MSTVLNRPAKVSDAAGSGVIQDADRVSQAAQQQMQWNRPNTSNPWAAQTSNPDGSVSLGFTGPLQGAQQNLMSEALRTMGTPTDFSQFNVGSGDDYRAQGTQGAQGQMDSWLAPLQGGFDGAEKQRLLSAGFEEGSPQFQAQMAKGAGTSADLRSSLGNAAIGMGGELGAKQQAMDLLSKQQGLSDALRQRALPMEQLGAMQGLLGQPGARSDGSIMAGATADLDHSLRKYMGDRAEFEAENADDMQAGMDLGIGAFKAAGTLGMSSMGGLDGLTKSLGPKKKGPIYL